MLQNVAVQLGADNRIVVRFGSEYRPGDSYYLGIDPRSPDHDCTPQTGLQRMLGAWLQALLAAADGELIYLPFDFSDEYTRWIACQRDGDQLLVVFGWAEVEGWAISPSDFSEYQKDLPGFSPDEPLTVQSFYRPWFISQIRRSIACCSGSADRT
jgi:hypothetical protein